MIASSTILAGTAIAGLATAGYGAYKNAGEQHKQAGLSAQAEELRKQQMQLEAIRKQREILRTAAQARATANVNATSQGAGYGSALPGSQAQIQARANEGGTNIRESLGIGEGLFDINKQMAASQGRAATAQGITTIGNALITNAGTIGNIGADIQGGIFGSKGPYNTATR